VTPGKNYSKYGRGRVTLFKNSRGCLRGEADREIPPESTSLVLRRKLARIKDGTRKGIAHEF